MTRDYEVHYATLREFGRRNWRRETTGDQKCTRISRVEVSIFHHIDINDEHRGEEMRSESLIAVCPLDIRLYTCIMTCTRVFYTRM